MPINWTTAHGVHQLPFLGAANRALHGHLPACPKCGASLRAYFHVFHSESGKGSLWVWCATCGMYTTLPRVKPTVIFPDPFAEVPRGEFGALETGLEEPFLDRLERFWLAGTLRLPESPSQNS